MEQNDEGSDNAGEDSGNAGALPCQVCLGETEGSEVTRDMKELPNKLRGEGSTSDVGAAKGTSAVEGEMGIPESLSMKSLSRSLTKEDVTSLSTPPEPEMKQAERGRELGRSQTIPRSFGAQSRRSLAQKSEKQSAGIQVSADAKVKVHQSTSLGTPSGSSVKQMLLQWCRANTRDYKYVDIKNFSSCWSDGMAFCALVHKFFPDSFDYSALSPKNRKQNFELAFNTAEKSADCTQLLEVEDLLCTGSPDWKCVYTYVQEFYRCLVQKGLVKTKQ